MDQGSFETGNNQRSIDPLEEKLNEREDELFEIDMQKAWMSSTLENARKLAYKIKGKSRIRLRRTLEISCSKQRCMGTVAHHWWINCIMHLKQFYLFSSTVEQDGD
ncbi:hypothetical protein GOBAR_DD33051 [Gossypium barbadense]|nr:hypothetical protein GOBAR_DD33051 [Gossypium barbadense]